MAVGVSELPQPGRLFLATYLRVVGVRSVATRANKHSLRECWGTVPRKILHVTTLAQNQLASLQVPPGA